MPESTKPAPGQVAWIDLTVPDADAVRDFYQQVTGWTASSVDMGGYADYCMNSSAGNMVAGICHARGVNAGLPPVWMVYIAVANLDEAMRLSVERGGKIRIPPRICLVTTAIASSKIPPARWPRSVKPSPEKASGTGLLACRDR